MRSITILLGTVLVLLLLNSDGHACSCASPRPVCESYGAAAAVFVGTVIGFSEIEQSTPGKSVVEVSSPVGYKFSVEQSYSGVPGTQVEVFTGRGGGDCGYRFKAGGRYLVYAYRDGDKDRLRTSICSRTKPFEVAREDIAFLGTLSSRPSGVTFSGHLRHVVKGKFDASDVSITIKTDTQRRELRPDAEGDFTVSGLSPGKIKVSVKLPEKYTTRDPEETFTVPDRGCVTETWFIKDNTQISGRVVNAEGLPVAGIQVTLEDPADRDRGLINYEPTDEEGRFLFAEVQPGRYLLSVNRSRTADPSAPNNAYAPTFYPGVTDETNARVIVVGAGERLSDLEVRVAKRAVSILEGSVVWPNGSPVKNAVLYVKDITDVDSTSHVMNADEQGRFKINGYVGQKLVIEAKDRHFELPSTNIPEPESAEAVTITLQSVTDPVRIVMRKLR